jgi:uncharacterized tellurite resistance protein B-like protein
MSKIKIKKIWGWGFWSFSLEENFLKKNSGKTTIIVLLYLYLVFSLWIIYAVGTDSGEKEIGFGGMFLGVVFFIILPIVFFNIKDKMKEHSENQQNSDTNITELFHTTSHEEKPRFQINKTADNYKWIPPGESCSILGYEIPDGMIYYGTHMRSYRSQYETDPCFIKTDLAINKEYPDYYGENMGYWPSYSEITPSNRSAYLDWLSSGKNNPKTNIGYVFLYFYGLERRLLYDTKKKKVDIDEIESVFKEINRLLSVYGDSSSSFFNYSRNLSEYIQVKYAKKKFYEFEPPKISNSWEIAPITKLAIGQLIIEEKPIPSDWMLSYIYTHPDVHLRTPGKRCKEEFEQLFHYHFSKQHGNGLEIKIRTSNLQINYHPASSSLRHSDTLTFNNFPNILSSQKLKNRASKLIEIVQSKLDKYSRWIGQHPDEKDSLRAIALLPNELTDLKKIDNLNNFEQWIDTFFNEQDHFIIENEKLFNKWPTVNSEKMNKEENLLFLSLIEKLGYGIIPDLRFDGINLKKNCISLIFKQEGNQKTDPSDEYRNISLFLNMLVDVVKSDGIIHHSEINFIERFVEKQKSLSSIEKRRLSYKSKWLLNSKETNRITKKNIEELGEKNQENLTVAMIAISGADGYISPEEIQMITHLHKKLGMNPDKVYKLIHHFQINEMRSKEDPITVQTASKNREEYKIPPPPQDQGFELNLKTLNKRMKDTQIVSSILEEVFTDEDEANVVVPSVTFQDFDQEYSEILLSLKEKEIWSRSDFETLVNKFGLFPDAVIEILNEKSIEILDEIFLENDDPIEIDRHVLKELLK